MKTLEKEFAEYKEHHKYEMIISALIMCEKEGIYEERLLNDYDNIPLHGKKKAYYVADDLYDRYMDRDEEDVYNAVYEMCWNKICNRIDNNRSYRIGVNYDED